MPPSEEHRLDEDATGKPREDGEDDDQGKKEDDGESSHTTTNENGKRPREPRLFSVTVSVTSMLVSASFCFFESSLFMLFISIQCRSRKGWLRSFSMLETIGIVYNKS